MKPCPPWLAPAALAFAAAVLATPARSQTAPPVQTPLPVVPAAPATQPLPANRWTAAQIRQAFELADADSNGELSRAEAQRLAIVPHGFEEMDQNKDGLITRAEYEAAFVR
jgi:hypothetical protein